MHATRFDPVLNVLDMPIEQQAEPGESLAPRPLMSIDSPSQFAQRQTGKARDSQYAREFVGLSDNVV